MKHTLIISATAVAASAITAGHAFCESAIPEKWKRDRYEDTVAASPFVLETVKEAPVETPKDEPMFINAISNVDGKAYVVIQKVGEATPIRLKLGEKGEDGITVTNVKMGEKFSTTEVEVDEGGKKRWIKFNESTAVTPATAQRPPGAPGIPGAPGAIRTAPAPSITPTISTGGTVPKPQQPTTGGQIPRPGNSPTISIPRPSGGPGGPGGQSFRGFPGSSQPSSAPGSSGGGRIRVREINNR